MVAIVVSDDYAPPAAFVVGSMIAACAFVVSVVSSDLVRHLTSLDCSAEDVGVIPVVIPKLELQQRTDANISC